MKGWYFRYDDDDDDGDGDNDDDNDDIFDTIDIPGSPNVISTRSRRYFREELFPWFFISMRQFHALVFHRMKSSSN